VGLVAGFAALLLSGCSGGWWPGRSDGPRPAVLPTGAVEYACAGGKRLVVRMESDARVAWILFPDREFRLDRAGSGDRYANAGNVLTVDGDTLRLDEEGRRTFDDCKRKTAGG